MTQRMLGKLAPRYDPRTLSMSRYTIPATLPTPPAKVDLTRAVDNWGMMSNDQMGCCTCSTMAHMVQVWTGIDDPHTPAITVPDAAVVAAYSAVSGYDPATGRNDNGAVVLDALRYWRGVGIGGRKILAYLALEPGNVDQIREALYMFGGVYVGIELPRLAQQQINAGQPWQAPYFAWGESTPGSWGGHAVNLCGYDSRWLACVTWGKVQLMSWRWWKTYGSEAYAVLSEDWTGDDKKSPPGFDLDALKKDLELLRAA